MFKNFKALLISGVIVLQTLLHVSLGNVWVINIQAWIQKSVFQDQDPELQDQD